VSAVSRIDIYETNSYQVEVHLWVEITYIPHGYVLCNWRKRAPLPPKSLEIITFTWLGT